MTIYTLYIKTHRKTGLKYFGQTKQDPYSYPGSGVDWTNHINDYGRDIYTEILLQTSDKSERNYWGRYYSKLWKIVTAMDDYGNKIWANRIPETGGGCGTGLTGWANPQYGKAPWNKGLTKADDYRIAQYATTLTGKVGHPAWNKGISNGYTTSGSFKKGNIPWNKGIPTEQQTWYGKNHTEESKLLMRKPKEKTECPYCSKIGGISQMKRWHFNNCKDAK
jgi:hypothetical protein